VIQSEREEAISLARRVFEEEYGARASYGEVIETVVERVANQKHLNDYFVRSGLRGAVSEMFAQRTAEGLPFAPVANKRGEHVAVPLMSFDEYEFVVRRYVAEGDAQYAQARKLARKARETFGKSIVVNGIDFASAGAA